MARLFQTFRLGNFVPRIFYSLSFIVPEIRGRVKYDWLSVDAVNPRIPTLPSSKSSGVQRTHSDNIPKGHHVGGLVLSSVDEAATA